MTMRQPGRFALAFIALFAGSTWLLARLTTRCYGELAGFLAALALNLTAYYGLAASTFALPDGPLLFFWLLTIDRLSDRNESSLPLTKTQAFPALTKERSANVAAPRQSTTPSDSAPLVVGRPRLGGRDAQQVSRHFPADGGLLLSRLASGRRGGGSLIPAPTSRRRLVCSSSVL